MTEQSAARAVDPVTGKFVAHLDNGAPYVPVHWGRRLLGYVLDAVAVLVLWMLVFVATAAATKDSATDSGQVLMFLGSLPVIIFLYGAVHGAFRAAGSAIVGTRTVRRNDGHPMGAWSGAWRALVTVCFAPLVVLVVLFIYWTDIGTGSSSFGGNSGKAARNPRRRGKFVVIDTRAGVARGASPVLRTPGEGPSLYAGQQPNG